MDIIPWLLRGDPAIRWQTLRDLTSASERCVERERRKIAREGWGVRLLAKQDAKGMWAGGLYTPKWTSTTYTMLLLRDLGLRPSNGMAHKACRLLLDGGFLQNGGIAFGARWPDRGETCVTSMVLSIASYFEYEDARLDKIAANVLGEQMPDGGWNCLRRLGATHSSFNTTIIALEALAHYELRRRGNRRNVRDAQSRGREFLLNHRLFRSHRTGRIAKGEFTLISFPPRWHYDILRALDYFRAVDAARDPRLSEAIDIVRGKQRGDGRWPLQHAHKGKVWFQLERVGAPSRWNTLRALRVLNWWNGIRSVP